MIMMLVEEKIYRSDTTPLLIHENSVLLGMD